MYLSREAVNWVCTAGNVVFAFIGFYFIFLILILLLLYYSRLHPGLLSVIYSTGVLFLSYFVMHVPCSISLAISRVDPVCLCSRHGSQCMFMIQIYRYTCAYLCSPVGIRITTRRGVLSDSPGSSCSGLGAWNVWILLVADQRGAAVAWISSRPSATLSFRAPACLPSFPGVTRERHLYCSYLYILCILAFAPYW